MVPEIALEANRAATRAYLSAITDGWDDLGEAVHVELRCLMPDRRPDVTRFGHDTDGLDALADHAIAMNATGLNCYVVVNPVRAAAPLRHSDGRPAGATDDDIAATYFFWADGDDEAAAHSIRSFAGPKYTMAVMTGVIPSPRPHIYWRIEDAPVRNLAAWTGIQKAIAAKLSTDRTVVNPSRIMRLPGTINWPTPKKIERGRVPELTTFRDSYTDDRQPVTFEQMRRAFGEAPGAAVGGLTIDTGSPATLDRERATIQALSGEEWHNAVIRLVASYVARGLSDGEIHALTDPLTLPGYTTDQTRREVQTAIDGARRKGWTPEPQYADPAAITPPQAEPSFDAPRRPVDLEWFDDIEPSLVDAYIVKGVLSSGAMSVVYGPSNSGKTFFVLDLAFCMAIGALWQGRRVRQAAVLYLAAEGGRGLLNRVAALKSAHGVCDVPLAVKRAGLDLLHDQADLQHIADLAGAVQTAHPDLPLVIVVDTLSRIMAGGDENSAADMTALIRNIDAIRAATQAHIILVHHTGKDTARGARGHSSLRAATDTEIEVSNEDGARAAVVTKQRDYQGGETFAFTLKSVSLGIDQDGDEVTSCVVETTDSDDFKAARKAKKGLGGTQDIILQTFDQMLGEGAWKPNPGGIGMPDAGRFKAVERAELRRLCLGKINANDPKSSFNKAMAALSDLRGLLGTGENMVWRTDRKVTQ